MKSIGTNVIAQPWSTLEELLFKECMFHGIAMDAIDITPLEKMNNIAVKTYCNSKISGASSQHLEVIPRERNSKDIEKMFSRMRKEDKASRVIFTKQIQLNFDASGKSTIACERRRIFSVTGSAENNVCEPEPENDFCDVTTFVFSLANHIA